MPDPAKMGGCLVAGFGDDRYVEAPADHLGDIASRDAFLGNAVVCGAGGTFLNHEPVETRGIEAMHCRPTVETVTHVGGNAFFARDANQSGNESVIAFAVNILVNSREPLSAGAKSWMISSFVLLFGAAGVGIGILFTRLEDYRQTINATKLMRDNPGVVTDEALIERAVKLRRTADRLNRATNWLIYIQPALFISGFICLAVSVFTMHGKKLV